MSRGENGIFPKDQPWKDVGKQPVSSMAEDGLVDKHYGLRSECCSETVKEHQCDFGIVAENPAALRL